MPRVGLSTERVTEEAEALADEVGIEKLTLAAVAARLSVRLPSLYKHVDGLEALRRAMAVRAKREVAEVFARAAVGRSGADAVSAMCHAYRTWAIAHPGRYELTVRAPAPGDAEDERASEAVVAVVADVLAAYRLSGDDAVDAIRGMRAVIHGFVDLERRGGFALPVDVDRSFDRLVTAFSRQLDGWPVDDGAAV